MTGTSKKELFESLKSNSDYVTYLLEAFEVPETNQESDDDDEVEIPRKKLKLMKSAMAETAEELKLRGEMVKTKFERRKQSRKSNSTTDNSKKKLKRDKKQKKQQKANLRKAMTVELLKKSEIEKKPVVKPDPDPSAKSNVYNSEGKLFFSKVQIDGEKKKKSHNTNPRENLLKLNAYKKKIKELVEAGDKDKAKEEKQKVLWKDAFDKTQGVKVKDNPEILKKTIKKRKMEKKKSKTKWAENKKKVEEKQAAAQKKREDNINKRKTDNLKTKKKLAIKKGRLLKQN